MMLKADRADRLLRRAAAGAGHAGDADADVRFQTLARPLGQRLCHLGRDGAVALHQRAGDAREGDLASLA